MPISDDFDSKLIKKDSIRVAADSFMVATKFEEFEEAFQQENENNAMVNDIFADVSKEEGEKQKEQQKQKEDQEKKAQEELRFNNMLSKEYKKGFEDGKGNAIVSLENDFKEKLKTTILSFSKLVGKMKEEFEDYKKNIDTLTLTLSLSIASKILKREVRLDDKIIINQVTEAIKKIIGVDNIVIFVNPEDESIIKLFKSDFRNTFESLKDILIQSNEHIDRGSCKIESGIGNVDSRFSMQLNIIQNALMEELNHNFENSDVSEQ